MPVHHIMTATEAARTFSELLNEVRYRGKSFDIKRGKEIIATISPVISSKGVKVQALNEIFHHLPSLDEKDLEDFEKSIKEMRKLKQDKNPWG